MEFLVYLGAVVSMLGVLGLMYCIRLALKARKSNLPEEEIKARLQKVVALNMGALALSAMGLIMVVIGILL